MPIPSRAVDLDPEFAEQRIKQLEQGYAEAIREDNERRRSSSPYVANWAMAAADAWTTYDGLETGGFEEVNPLYSWAVEDEPLLVFPMAAGHTWLLNRLARKTDARWIAWLSAALHAGAAAHNYDAVESYRDRQRALQP